MANTMDVLGALLGRGMTDSSNRRVEHALGEQGLGGLGGMLEQLGMAPAREPVGAQTRREGEMLSPLDAFGGLGKIAGSMFGEGNQSQSMAAGGLGALVGAILGGGSKSAKGAIGGGALALLGAIALKALRRAQSQSPSQEIDPSERLAAGLREPANDEEAQEVASIVDLTVRAMINAAKADGRIDEDEMQKVVGELQADGLSADERNYLLAEARKPLDTEALVRAVPNRQVAAQIYAASLLAIEVDTPAEKAYLAQLARELDLDNRVVSQIHATVGLS